MSSEWNSLLDGFVKSIASGDTPRIEAYLGDVDDDAREQRLRQLLAIEAVSRQARGESPSAADYRARFPRDHEVIDDFFASTTIDAADEDTLANTPDSLDVSTDDSVIEATMDLSSSRSRSTPGASVPQGAAGRHFGDYELIEEIARGGMGVVYRARQLSLDRTVALKMILSGQLANENEVERFHTEAKAAANLDHPGILPVYEINQRDDQHYFTMALAEGGSLSDEIKVGPISAKRAAEIVCDVAAAVQHAHDHGIIHRDLKPANILMDANGNPKVTDFGLAKHVGGDSHMTATGQILGTPSYMPPEQASGKISDVDARSDVYSLGAVLYVALTGQPPFLGDSSLDVIQQVLAKEPTPLRKINPRAPLDLEIICARCLEKDPKRRLQSAAEVHDELKRFLNHEPILSRPIGAAEKTLRWGLRNRFALGLAASVLLAIGASLLAWYGIQNARSTRELAGLGQQIEESLDATEWSQSKVESTENLIAKLSEHDAKRAALASERLRLALQTHFDSLLRKPNLTADDRVRIDGFADLLAARSDQPEQTRRELDQVLQGRLRVWETVFDFQAPFEDAADVFPFSVVRDDQLVLMPRKDKAEAKKDPAKTNIIKSVAVLAESVCEGHVRVETAFPVAWAKSSHLGLVLNGADKQGYAFLISAKAPSSTTNLKAPTVTFEEAARQGGSILARLQRDGVRLTEKEYSLAAFGAGVEELHLTASRQGDQLWFQINSEDPIKFRDLFPIPNSRPGKYAIYLPLGMSVKQVRVSRQSIPRTPSPLEQADSLYADQKYREAMTLYARQTVEAENPAVGREAAYKEGLCLAALKRFDEAGELFAELLSDSDKDWAARAACQLWLLQLKQNKDEEADVTLQRLASLYTFEELAVLIPPDDRDQVLARYRADDGGGYQATLFKNKRLRNLERLVSVHRVLQVSRTTRFNGQLALLREYLRLERFADAEQLADELFAESWLTPYKRWRVIEDSVWIARHSGRTNKLAEQIDEWLYDNGKLNEKYLTLLVESARLKVIDEDWKGAEEAAGKAFELRRKISDSSRPLACLLYGFILEHNGQREKAQEVWRTGYEEARVDGDVQYLSPMILGSLSGAITVEDTQEVIAGVAGAGGGPYLTYLQNRFVPLEFARATLNNMWRQTRGRDTARKMAFRELGYWEAEYIQAPLAANEIWRQCLAGTFEYQGDLDPEKEELIWDLTSKLLASYQKGELGETHVLLLALAWKGSTGSLGWRGFANAANDESRCGLAYVLGCRYAKQLKQLDDARKLLREAESLCKPGTTLAKLIAIELKALPMSAEE